MENKRFYVYVYLNQLKPGKWTYKNLTFDYQPFYVGKGTNNRDVVHLFESSLKLKNVKNSVIKSIIKKTGEQPIHYRVYENITEEQAICIEKDFIRYFGRYDNNTGILSNGTDGGDGANNFSLEVRKKIGVGNSKKLYQYDLNGNFIKEWESLIQTKEILDNPANISTSIKRGGTCGGFIWSYDFVEKFEPKIKYQAPIKYRGILQIDSKTKEVLNTFDTVLEAEKKLNLREGAKNKIYECLANKLKTAYGYKWKIQEG